MTTASEMAREPEMAMWGLSRAYVPQRSAPRSLPHRGHWLGPTDPNRAPGCSEER